MTGHIHNSAPLPANTARALAASYPLRVLVFLGLHAPLALLVDSSRLLATAHALTLPAIGFFFILRDRSPRRLLYVVGYMTGAETLWRLRTALNFEYDKYAIGVLLVAALLKYSRDRRPNWWPALYFALLIPGIYYMPFFDRQAVAFNLAGPALLSVAAVFFSLVTIDRRQLRHFLLAVLAPIVGVATLAIFTAVTTEGIVFTGGTNPYTSGGDGGNQISAMMGLGAMAAFVLTPLFREHRVIQFVLIGLAVDLLSQSAFTFARGGLYAGVGACLVFAVLSVRDPRQRRFIPLALPLIILLSIFFVLPIFNDFTNGALMTRLQSSDTTGRDLIALKDLELFVENPLTGVGVGESIYAHVEVFRLTQPHTEPTRMLAEHGLPGLLSLVILLGLTMARVLRPDWPENKLYAVTFLAWSLVTMLHVAMRLAAPGIFFAVGAMAWLAPAPSGTAPFDGGGAAPVDDAGETSGLGWSR